MKNITKNNVMAILRRSFNIKGEEDSFDPHIKWRVLVENVISFLKEKGFNYRLEEGWYPSLYVEYNNQWYELDLSSRYCLIDRIRILKGHDISWEIMKLRDEYNNKISRRKSL